MTNDDYQDMVRRVAAQEKRKQQKQQQPKPVKENDDDEVMESRLYAMRKAGYDIL